MVRKVAIAMFSAILVIVFHRWVAMQQELLSPQIISVDLCILGAGFASCSPVLKSAFLLASLSFGIGALNYIVPQTIWMGTILLTAACFFWIGRDGWRL